MFNRNRRAASPSGGGLFHECCYRSPAKIAGRARSIRRSSQSVMAHDSHRPLASSGCSECDMNINPTANAVPACDLLSACARPQPVLVPRYQHLHRQYLDASRFEPPKNFGEFYRMFPRHVRDFVRRRMTNRPREDQQDRESELLTFLMTLPQASKFRTPGTNGHEDGCLDRIMTFNPVRCGGDSPGHFLGYVNRILLNRFISLEGKDQSNPVCRHGTLRISYDRDHETGTQTHTSISTDDVSLGSALGDSGQQNEVLSQVVV
jgi:hypothetical protein